ncbi:MAG: hypothetical protein IJF72_01315 [Clostridia bacterium]|nr:hypothetical protein [Clostridia bacterium]
MNPFLHLNENVKHNWFSLKELACKPYNKFDAHPYTKIRVILANGAEFEAVWFLHQFHRHCADNDLRRELAYIRREEQQQQKRLASLKPINESILEHTIGYEQLAVELTALFAKRESDPYVKKALDFALLEDFDHLYRYADLLDMQKEVKAENLVGKLTEIMPGRPTVAEHRCPCDDIKRWTNFNKADLLTKLQVCIITAAEQQTMNYYMNQANFYTDKLGRELYSEIAQIEEQHVSLYGGLMDVNTSWLECLVMHEYTECYLYWSLANDETDPYIKKVFQSHFDMELSHLARASRLLEKYGKKDWHQVVGDGDFPEPIKFGDSVDYVRDVIANQVTLTGKGEEYVDVSQLESDDCFFQYQDQVVEPVKDVASHCVIAKHIADCDTDYRYQTKEHPIESLRDQTRDNTELARK